MYIYKTTNLINNKIYIGLSTKSVEESTDYYGSGKLINVSINKHGIENFTKEILEDSIEDYDILCQREIYWISHFKSTEKGIGYNLTDGGSGGNMYKYRTPEELAETRLKLSNNASNMTALHKANLSKASRAYWDNYQKNPDAPKRVASQNQREANSKNKKGTKLYYNPETGHRIRSKDICPLGYLPGFGPRKSPQSGLTRNSK
jgi:group I intron endonuclease